MMYGSEATFEMAPSEIDYEGVLNVRTKRTGCGPFKKEAWMPHDAILSGRILHLRPPQIPRTTCIYPWSIIYLDDVEQLMARTEKEDKPRPEYRLKLRGRSGERKWKLVMSAATSSDLAAWLERLSNVRSPTERRGKATEPSHNIEEIVDDEPKEEFDGEIPEDAPALQTGEAATHRRVVRPSTSPEAKATQTRMLNPESAHSVRRFSLLQRIFPHPEAREILRPIADIEERQQRKVEDKQPQPGSDADNKRVEIDGMEGQTAEGFVASEIPEGDNQRILRYVGRSFDAITETTEAGRLDAVDSAVQRHLRGANSPSSFVEARRPLVRQNAVSDLTKLIVTESPPAAKQWFSSYRTRAGFYEVNGATQATGSSAVLAQPAARFFKALRNSDRFSTTE